MRLLSKVKLLPTVVLLMLSEPALAGPNIVEATVPTFGCPQAEQLQHVTITEILTNEPLPSGCFHIKAGELAYIAAEWQRNGLDLWRNIGVFATQSGRRFYSWPSTWRKVGKVRRFVQ